MLNLQKYEKCSDFFVLKVEIEISLKQTDCKKR